MYIWVTCKDYKTSGQSYGKHSAIEKYDAIIALTRNLHADSILLYEYDYGAFIKLATESCELILL